MFRIEPINKGHSAKHFDCGEADLNTYLKQFARRNDANDIGRTYVATRPGEADILGYYTISTGAVKFQQLPADLKLPRYPTPTVHIGRLAADLTVQGQGLGEALLFDALRRAAAASEVIGIKMVELIAIHDKAKSFYQQYGFTPLRDEPLHLYLNIGTIRELLQDLG
jgi:GNAT superfamily N-acetyltransferase